MPRHSGGHPLDPRRVRPIVLTGTLVLTVTLPLAVASAGPLGGAAPLSDSARASAHPPANASGDVAHGSGARVSAEPAGGRAGAGSGAVPAPGHGGGDGSRVSVAVPAGPAGASSLDEGLATVARCGPEVVSPDGIEAQTCVLTRGRERWARAYYRNATGDGLTSVLTLMAPGGHTVRMHCALGADDEPGACETPRGNTAGGPSGYTAIAEFAEGTGGPLLLRSGSNPPAQKGR